MSITNSPRRRTALCGAILTLGLAGTSTFVATPALAASSWNTPIGVVNYLGSQTFPVGYTAGGVPVGGLSGLDYDASSDTWYVISDDTVNASARFSKAKVKIDSTGATPLQVTSVPFQRPDGSVYPANSINPESIRLDPLDHDKLWWSQEGWRKIPTDGSTPLLVDPSIRETSVDGVYEGDLPIDPKLHMSTDQIGPRNSSALEGLTFADNGQQIVTSIEGPMYQDGPIPTPTTGAVTRLIVQDRTGKVLHEYAYPLDKVFSAGNPAGLFENNGISEILAYEPGSTTKFLVIERAFAYGVGFHVRIYLADTSGATDVKNDPGLAASPAPALVTKKLVLDMSDTPVSAVYSDEGIAWGPKLPNGDRTFALVTDNNFTDPTQFALFSVH